MKLLFRFLLLFLILNISVLAEAKQADISLPITVTASVDRQSVSIGDRIRYTIEASAEKDIEVKFPEFGDNLAEFTIKDFGSSKNGIFGSRTYSQWYILDTFETGKFTIPMAIIQFREEGQDEWKGIATKQIDIEVLSLLDDDINTADIRDIKGPVSHNSLLYLYIILSLLAAALIVFLAIKFLKMRRLNQEAPAPPVPAHETAYEALGRLRKKGLLKTGRVREYYFELSGILRQYMEDRFDLKAPEMTTEEFLATLKSSRSLDTSQKGLVRAFLSSCDMVKFARHLPAEEEAESSYDTAKRLVDETRESYEEEVK